MKKGLYIDQFLLLRHIDREGLVQSKTEIKIPLKKEEIHVSKEPYIKEEIIIKKKPVVETRTVSEEVKSEKISVKENMKGEEREYS